MSRAIIQAELNDGESHGDSIDMWLAVLVRLLDISSSKRDAIRDEIEAHLRERVRDLLIAGTPERDAIRRAISELGEVADLARRFSHASKLRTRRTIMNAAVLAVGGVSVAMAAIFLNGPQPNSHVAIFQPPSAVADESSILADRASEANFNANALGDVFKFLASQSGLDLVVDRRAMENRGLSLEEPISLELANPRPVSQILELVAHQFETPFAWRVHDQILEISMPEEFDRREIVLASFDVQAVLDRICEDTGDVDVATSRLESLVIDYVEPEAWTSVGGDLANLRIVGGRMFVKAPSRFHQPIEWMLSQLEESAATRTARHDPFADGGALAGQAPASWRLYTDTLGGSAPPRAIAGPPHGATTQPGMPDSGVTTPAPPAAGAPRWPVSPVSDPVPSGSTGGGAVGGASPAPTGPSVESGGSSGSSGGASEFSSAGGGKQ